MTATKQPKTKNKKPKKSKKSEKPERHPKWGYTTGPYDVRHGTVHCYSVLRCRCDDCRLAWANHCQDLTETRLERAEAEGRDIPHGTRNAWLNYRCRCDVCRDAHQRDLAEVRGGRSALAFLMRMREHGETNH